MLTQFAVYSDWAWMFLRVALAIIFVVHGLPKFKNKGLLTPGGKLQGLVEVLGAAGLILNWYVQLIALVFSVIMLGAIYFKVFKWRIPFKASNNTGWEFDLILLAANLLLLTARFT